MVPGPLGLAQTFWVDLGHSQWGSGDHTGCQRLELGSSACKASADLQYYLSGSAQILSLGLEAAGTWNEPVFILSVRRGWMGTRRPGVPHAFLFLPTPAPGRAVLAPEP